MHSRISREAIAALVAVLLTLPTGVARAQQSLIGINPYPSPIYPGTGYPGYGGGGYPIYGNYPPNQNPSTQLFGQPPQQQPGQTQLPLSQGGGGGGGQGGGGQGGGGQNGQGGGGGGGGGGGQGADGNDSQGASFAVMQDQNSPLYKRYERLDPADQQIRPRILAQIGRGRGIRRGYIDEVARLRATVEGEGAARLDAHYDFTRVMIGEHLVPPVIGEVHAVQQSGGDKVLYLTMGAYQIVRSARLVLNPPNWRDYLFIEVAEPQTATTALAPRTPQERDVYDQSYDDGVAKGVKEARETFDDNLNRLDRDFAGMERYHELARQGAVSLPVVKDARHAVRVAANGQRAFVGEQVVTLRVDPRFKAARRGAFQ